VDKEFLDIFIIYIFMNFIFLMLIQKVDLFFVYLSYVFLIIFMFSKHLLGCKK